MTPRVEASDQEVRVLAHVRGAGLNFTENRRTILAVFMAVAEPVTITDLWLRAKKADPRTSHSTVGRLLRAYSNVDWHTGKSRRQTASFATRR
jgi:Fe2+ or Zn2+ uptake regulation protein